MKTTNHFPILKSIFAALLILPAVALAQTTKPAGITRTDLQRHDISIPGHETVQARIDFEPGATFGNHTHPGEEVIYVLEGEFEYEVDGKPIRAKAGEVLFIPAGAVHAAKNIGKSRASEFATYIVEKGKPLLTLQKM